MTFLQDMFTGPKPPPRSYYEATLWRGKRQVKVIGYVLLFMLFVGWGLTLVYYTIFADNVNGCSTAEGDRPLQSLYNVAYLLCLLLFIILFLFLFLGCCVLLDLFINGRVRLVLLLGNPDPPLPPPPEQYAAGSQGHDERLVPGVPKRDGYGGQYGTAGEAGGGYEGGFLVGSVAEPRSRLCNDSNTTTASWASPGAKLPKSR